MVEAPSPPTILFPSDNTGGWQPVNVIVIHSAVMDLYCGAARDLSNYGKTSGLSWHYSIDNCETFQNVWDNTVAWHCGWNYGTLGIEMAEMPSQNMGRWDTAEHTALLHRLADLVRQLCLYYDLPMVKLNTSQLNAGHQGICGHNDIDRAYTTHWDPGAFPWNRFLALVAGEDDPGGDADPQPEVEGWPLDPGEYFGPADGPAESIGGWYGPNANVRKIQNRFQELGFAPNIDGWSDGVWEQPTTDACLDWERANNRTTDGIVTESDWYALFEEDELSAEAERKINEIHQWLEGLAVESVKDPRPGQEGNTLYLSTALDWQFGWLYNNLIESVKNPYGGENETIWAGTAWDWTTQWIYQIKAKQEALAQAVAALADDSELTVERVTEIINSAVEQNMPDNWELTGTSENKEA